MSRKISLFTGRDEKYLFVDQLSNMLFTELKSGGDRYRSRLEKQICDICQHLKFTLSQRCRNAMIRKTVEHALDEISRQWELFLLCLFGFDDYHI